MKGTTDGDSFYHFVQTCLLPHLMPFDGINPHSIVVMDNCTIHHVEHIVKSIQDVGALVHFLPHYSPDLQPIEETFSKIKTEIKILEQDNDQNSTDVELLLLTSFTSITPEDCQG